jgi:hypothetical protein
MNKPKVQGISSSMQSPMVPITPRTARTTHFREEEMELESLGVPDSNGVAVFSNGDEEEGDSLLGLEKKPARLSNKDRHAIILLIVLCQFKVAFVFRLSH